MDNFELQLIRDLLTVELRVDVVVEPVSVPYLEVKQEELMGYFHNHLTWQPLQLGRCLRLDLVATKDA